MSFEDRNAAGAVTFAGGVLDRYRHVCAFLNGPGEQDAVLPMVLIGGMLQENPFFVPPDEFLAERSRHANH